MSANGTPPAPGTARAAGDAERLACGGVPALVRRQPAHPVVAVRLYVRGGSANVGLGHAGAELFYARVARRGTERFPKPVLNAALARMGTDLGVSASEDFTLFQMRCLRRHLAPSWEILADIVLHPLLAPEELEVVRHQMLLEIQQRRDDPDGRLGDLGREIACAGHPYAAHPAGTAEAIGALGAETLRAHAGRVLARRNLLLVVIGDVSGDELADLASPAFAALADGAGPPPFPPPHRFAAPRLRAEGRELPTNYVLGQFAAPCLADGDHPAVLLALSILRDRLFEEVRTKRNLSYAPAAGLGGHAANLGWIYVTCTDPRTTLGVMRATMRSLREERLEPKELADRVQVFITRYYLQNETNQAQAGFLAGYELLGGGWERSREFVARLEALTPEDVRSAAAAVLRNIQYAYLGDTALAEPEIFTDP
jgi:zinc protease